MLSGGDTIFMVLVTGEFLLTILINGFIALVNFIDWIKSKKLSSSDVILVSLAISRIGLACAIIWNSNLVVIHIDVRFTAKLGLIDILFLLTHNTNIWSATTLSIFYLLKITNFSHPLFLWMKWRIDRMVFLLLGGPLIITVSILFPLMEKIQHYYSILFNRGKERNVSQEDQVSKSFFIMIEIIISFLGLIPFILSTVSLSLFILSLWRHKQQMQIKVTGSRDPSTEAHVRAMKAVSSFLILFLLYYTSLFFNYWSYSVIKNKLPSMLSMSTMLLYPFGHSLVLILWNSKLRKVALRMSWLMRCCQRERYL
ncbi:taste receptor type 2 member 7-like [Macrotis lagotis]|uniref:taste receptor type 2 member 7-like n=1 Tax=Macrotis lagotis TaxID=92651 RepID=UPI003D69A201